MSGDTMNNGGPGPTTIPTASKLERELEDFGGKLRQPVMTALKILGLPNPDAQLDEAIEALKAIAMAHVKPVIPFRDRVNDTLACIEQAAKTKPLSVIKFGIEALDNALLPIEPGNQIVICAETGGGKTALAIQAALSSPEQAFAIFSMEMDAKALIMRMFTSESCVPLSSLRQGRLTKEEYRHLKAAAELLKPRNIHIEDEQLVDVHGIAARCRAMKQSGGLSAVMVDYLQLVAPSTTGKRDVSREREVAEVSRSLKRLALELGVVVVALSQLNDDGRLRESRAIGQDADVVLRVVQEEEGDSIRILKHRNGALGVVPVMFDGSHLRFLSRTQSSCR
jgi:replicative DNA helicase